MDRNVKNRSVKGRAPAPQDRRRYEQTGRQGQPARAASPQTGPAEPWEEPLHPGEAPDPQRMMNDPRYRALMQRRRAARREMQRRRRRRQLGTLLGAVALVVLGTLFGVNVLFKVSDYRVENPDKADPVDLGVYTQEEILEALDVDKGSGIFAFSTDEKAREVGEELPYLETVEVKRSLPSTVILRVTPAKEAYCVETMEGWLVLSRRGKVLRLTGDRPRELILLEGLPVEKCGPGDMLKLAEPEEEGALSAGRVLGEMLAYMDREALLEGTTSLWLQELTNLSFLYDGRIRVELGTANSLDYKLQLAGYLLRNENGDALSESDTGTLDCSHITAKGEIRPVFSPDAPAAEEPPAPDGDGTEAAEA